MAASAAVANVLLLKKRADDRQRAALRIKFEVFSSNLIFFINVLCVLVCVFLVRKGVKKVFFRKKGKS